MRRWALGAELVVAAACGSGTTGTARTAGDATTTTPAPFYEAKATIVSVDRLVDERHLAVTLGDVPSGGPGCEVTIVDHSAEARSVESLGPDRLEPDVRLARADGSPYDPYWDGTWPGCTLAPRPTQVALAAPYAGQSVQVADPYSALWVPDGDGGFAKCTMPACDPETGHPPDPNGCDRALTEAVRAEDVPAHSDLDVRACEGGWAVVDIDFGSGACGPTEEGPNPCAGSRVDRTFWRRTDARWQLITYGTREVPGCADADLPPDFPRTLCESLPPVGKQPTP